MTLSLLLPPSPPSFLIPKADCYALGRPFPVITIPPLWLPLGPVFLIPLNNSRVSIFVKLVLGCSVPLPVCSPLGAFCNVFSVFYNLLIVPKWFLRSPSEINGH